MGSNPIDFRLCTNLARRFKKGPMFSLFKKSLRVKCGDEKCVISTVRLGTHFWPKSRNSKLVQMSSDKGLIGQYEPIEIEYQLRFGVGDTLVVGKLPGTWPRRQRRLCGIKSERPEELQGYF